MARGLRLSKDLSVRELSMEPGPARPARASAFTLMQSRTEAARRRRRPFITRRSLVPLSEKVARGASCVDVNRLFIYSRTGIAALADIMANQQVDFLGHP